MATVTSARAADRLARLLDRVGGVALLTLFVGLDAQRMLSWLPEPGNFGYDAALYRLAAQAWLTGGNPWTVTLMGAYFGGPPPTLLVSLPSVAMDELVARIVWMLLAFGASVYSVRKLHLPLWWVAFPPLWISVMAGNLNPLVLALMLASAGPLAVFAKAYAIVPLVLLRRWREIAWTLGLLLLTLPLLPWGLFFASSSRITQTFVDQTAALSAWGTLAMVPAVVLVVLLRDRGAWLSVPALWPYTQIHYAALALPACSRWVAALMAVQVPFAPVAALGVAAIEHLRAKSGSHAPDPERVARRAGVGAGQPDNAEFAGRMVLDRDRVDVVEA